MKKFWKEFKEFISRGNVLDMAVGVIIGGAFNAIVTALVNILMSICTWRVPGGIKGLVSVLPSANPTQAGLDPEIGLVQKFSSGELQTLARALAEKNYGVDAVNANLNLIESAKTTIMGKYTLHGTLYTYNLSSVIDWGTFINAIISFLIVAITLFVIIKVAAKAAKARAELKEKLEKEKATEEAPAEEEKAE